jgi:F-type H+-transporting ATPase subunit delta|tara:strand:+ start:247 stop:807 length:561 start_codon:yes stop_codon:yes gene_type:complete
MSNSNIRQIASVERYANALFQLAKEAKVLDTISTDLNNLKKILNSHTDFLSLIKNPSIGKSVKINVFNAIAKKIELSKLTTNFIGVIIKKNRISFLLDMISAFDHLIASLKGERSATITSAQKLSESEIKDIKIKLKEKFDADFIINLVSDPDLIGGLKIQIGSQMIDSSIKNQLQLLKEKMKEVA